MRTLMLTAFLFAILGSTLHATDCDKPPAASVVSLAHSTTTRAPGQLTTIFAANNSYAGNIFDIVPLTTLSDVTAFDINWSSAGETVEVDVYYKPGSCVGYETNPSAWDLLASGSGTAAGLDLPTFIDVSGISVYFDAGETYGMCIQVSNYTSLTGDLGYTNGQDTFANAELSLTTYYGCAEIPFAMAFYPRIWNGTIYYEAGPPPPLSVYPDKIHVFFGGKATFWLNGGPDLGGRQYGLFGTGSGTTPGTPLPGGLTLPINWDWFTSLVISLALSGSPVIIDFTGVLDSDGYAKAVIDFPGHCIMYDKLLTTFAWCTAYPFDFVSNTVEVTFLPVWSHPYIYDDGSSENALGWTAGGESVWVHYFDSGTGDTIREISSTFGWAGSSDGPANGDPCWVYVWDDPTNDNDPIDAKLVGTGSGVVAHTNTDIFSEFTLDVPAKVTGGFFIGCHVYQAVGVYAAPMDTSTPYGGEAWFLGGAVFDPTDLTTTYIYELGSIGFPAYWLLRAN